MVAIKKIASSLRKEPGAMGFAGGSMSGFWQSAVAIQTTGGYIGASYGTQNPLWCSKQLYGALQGQHGPVKGERLANELMYALTKEVLTALAEQDISAPEEAMLRAISDPAIADTVRAFYRKNGLQGELPFTYILNAAVAPDLAVWMATSQARGIDNFNDLTGHRLSHRAERVAVIPLVSYGIREAQIEDLIDQGYRIFKTKMGAYDDRYEKGSVEDFMNMMKVDREKLQLVSRLTESLETDLTEDGRVPLYLDFNGRIPSDDRGVNLLQAYMEVAASVNALDRIIVVEEPFEDMKSMGSQFDVFRDFMDRYGVTIVADECAHSAEDVRELLALGCRGFALKPAAKTLTETLRMIDIITGHNDANPDDNAYCFCADLTVVPSLVEWNLHVQARLPPWPGLAEGVRMLESNWMQHYLYRNRLPERYPASEVASPEGGVFLPTAEWFRTGGRIFHPGGQMLEKIMATLH